MDGRDSTSLRASVHDKVTEGVVREFLAELATVDSAGPHEYFVVKIAYWLMAHGTTRARDMINMDDASIEFLSPLDKLVRALAVQGDGGLAQP